nr:Myc-type, basic helix-loop-helix (bHLH) domain-containing protein [Tanacetum cinerariifolium]
MVSEQVNSATELTGSNEVNITKELTRAPSFLDRVKSFKLTSPFKSNSLSNETFTSQDEHIDVPSDLDVVEDHNDTSDNSRYNNVSNAMVAMDSCREGGNRVGGIENNMTQIDTRAETFKDDQYILVTKVKQVFYLEDKAKPYWRVVEHVNHKKFSDRDVIVVEDDHDIIHFDNSSDLLLSTSLNDLDNASLHIDGQSTEIDVPPDIIDVVDEDDDITDDEDALPHDLA